MGYPVAAARGKSLVIGSESGSSGAAIRGTPSVAARQFVQRDGQSLILDGQPFRFAGCNIWFLGGYVDQADAYLPLAAGELKLPSRWRIDDAYATASAMGCQVIRGYSLGGTVGTAESLYPTLGGDFNEETFRVIDYAIARAPAYGLRVTPVMIDNLEYNLWRGGGQMFSNWGGVNFYNDPVSIANFKEYLTRFINRINTVNGLRYGDDPAIFGWQLGNELPIPATTSWAQQIAAHIKPQVRQLIIDGRFGVDTAILGDSNIDIIEQHGYPMLTSVIASDLAAIGSADKVYVIGEYDVFSNRPGGVSLADYLAYMEGTARVQGSSFWSLASHDDVSGWPSDTVGDAYVVKYGTPSQQSVWNALTEHAYVFRGLSEPMERSLGFPKAFASGSDIAWRGAGGAATYRIQRSTNGLSFTTIASGLSDEDVPWTDPSGTAGKYYRVLAVSDHGSVSKPSNVISF